MPRAALLLLAALALASCVHAEEDVVTVSGMKHLKKLAKAHPFLVVEFYAPWCGHCKKLEPEWAKAATGLKGFEPEIVLAKVDATAKENEEMKGKFAITGFPTIKIFKGGNLKKPFEYAGPREEAGIVSYLKKQVQPAYQLLETADAVAAAKEAAEGSLLLAFLESNATDEFKVFADVADQLRNDLDFAYVIDHSLVEECKTADCKSPFVVMVKKEEAEQPKYEGAFTADLLKTWASAKALPLVIRFGPPAAMKALQKAFAGTSPRLVAIVKEDSEPLELVELLQQASKANDDLAVILVPDKAGKRMIDYYGVKPTTDLVLLIDEPKSKSKYLKAEAKPSDVPEFLRQFQEGALEKWLKSEEVPAENDDPVKVIVAKNFEEEVLKSGKDVFIEFYAPWCGHCNALKPIWEELGKAYQGDDSIVIAKMDATANDIPTDKMAVRGYPTLFFVKADGEVMPYKGNRGKEDLLKFTADNCTKCKKVEEEKPAAMEDTDEDSDDDEDKKEL
ncbi:disulfide isomerase-like 1-2 [Micractinium conductrix]|uniref:Protein disulfide-isomerase n=1 Tax=Micractinium conductrix TaxID=554055 RepID=A0A2P6VMF2_9CHLO|nr:disulfide isomerase-like 1-2 [Micractinium conductrix]|eukprot:PSC75237.1 disulfide isomerase-like 1-2 [Micractinium conductrix]